MIVFRLSRSEYASDLSGNGALKAGGRWNSKGTPLLYTSESRALCTAEMAVHLSLGLSIPDYVLVSLTIPDSLLPLIPQLKESELPQGWRVFPYIAETSRTGDKLVRENKLLGYKIPSAVVPGDFNFILNPHHKNFTKIKIIKTEKFEFDKRLLRR